MENENEKSIRKRMAGTRDVCQVLACEINAYLSFYAPARIKTVSDDVYMHVVLVRDG